MALEVELEKKKLEYTNEKGEKVRVDVDQEQTDKEEEVFESNHYSNLAEELEQTERIAKIKSKYEKQLEALRRKKAEKIKNNPFLKDEDVAVDDNIQNDDVSSSCLICHK